MTVTATARMWLFGAVALTLLIYWPGLNGPLLLDDVPNLETLRRLAVQGSLTLANVLAEKDGLTGARPVSWLSFVLNWRWTGEDVWALKLTNLVLHVLNGVLIYLSLSVLLRIARTPPVADPRRIAALAAAFWLLTPVQVSTVLYVVQRMAELAALFTLSGLLAWCHARRLERDRPRTAAVLVGLALLVCWPLAALSKQNGVLLVALLLAAEWLVVAPALAPARWPVRLLAGCVGVLLAAGALRAWLDPGWITEAYTSRDFTLVERLLTQPRVLVHYLLNVLQLPGGTPLGLFHDDFQASTGVMSPFTTILALAFWSAVPLAAWRLRATVAGPAAFGLVFFLVASALEAGPFALELYFEHRSYLPSVGLALMLAAAVAAAGRHFGRPRLALVLAGLLVAGHAAVTAARVLDWTSWESLVEANARRHPDSVRAQTGLAVVAFTAGRLQPGLAALERARRNGGERVRAGVALHTLTGHCLAGVPPPTASFREFESLEHVGDAPYTVGALRWYREVVTAQRCPGQHAHAVAMQLSRRIMSNRGAGRRGGNWLLHDEAARLLAAAGEPSIARLHLARALRFAPPSARAALRARQVAAPTD